ncbi:hypothetical protein H0920_00775 [Acinetobacter sp. C_4_1]|uniref:hypothetical protein n=1 Tax=unclassified Acinetobacter TaxID=196816 RepID=UPI0021B802AE|nr:MULTISPECIES: hypothetical protein [unclassified Acinetobacter]MCT8088629.1 hypothetical protein [Acinetobacter sp. F_3_1]MCT8096785.1 hypothetical protein [Acinetobacter sp. C_3_1]MCT8099660.1 hypothetical protein [Acinetobacter sp. C_4_1]MCT8133628.1 hypothetical protein [Acinetobacter sp. T_3_1]
MNQPEFEKALRRLLEQPLTSATFNEVRPVAEALLYSEFLPAVTHDLNSLQKRRLVFLLEKFRRYSCSSVSRRQQLKSFSQAMNVNEFASVTYNSRKLVDPLAKRVGLNEDLNHLKPQLLTLQTRHYSLHN